MTGKELIVYILQNNLEKEQVIQNGKPIGFLTAEEAAAKMHVGKATVEAYISMKKIEGYELRSGIYIPVNSI